MNYSHIRLVPHRDFRGILDRYAQSTSRAPDARSLQALVSCGGSANTYFPINLKFQLMQIWLGATDAAI